MIPDDIIEKAARAKFYRAHPEYADQLTAWGAVAESYRQMFRESVVRTLPPVYADIQAATLREAATAQRGSLWLRARANELDGGTS